MSTKGTQIPQAFSSKDVSEAFLWLQSQPEKIRGQVKSTEQLMGLFFRYKRTGGTQFLDSVDFVEVENAAHQAKFKDTLKQLSGEMDQFTEPQHPPMATPVAASKVSPSPSIIQSDADPSFILDPRSLEIIHSIKKGLNLATDSDVIRMCLVLGYEKLRQIIPPEN